MKKIDATGLVCPEPVLRTRETLEEEHPDTLEVIVDNEAAMENVRRFLEFNDYRVSTRQEEKNFTLTGKISEDVVRTTEEQTDTIENIPPETSRKIMVLCSTDRMGNGDDELGLKLMASFLNTLDEMGPDLWRLVFVNNGVKLTIENSGVLPTLQKLAGQGLKILVCGTCLTHFNLLDKKQVGETTNMLDIVTAMQLSDNVITL